MMTTLEKINFVNTQQSDKYFDKDAELYRKCFPASRLNNEIARANLYNKTHLDGRMLLEILEVVCGETILENRGIVADAAQEPAPVKAVKKPTKSTPKVKKVQPAVAKKLAVAKQEDTEEQKKSEAAPE